MSRDYKNRIPGYARPRRKRSSQTWWVPGAALALVVFGFIVVMLAGGDDEDSTSESDLAVPLTSEKDTQQVLSLHPEPVGTVTDPKEKKQVVQQTAPALSTTPDPVPSQIVTPARTGQSSLTPLALPSNPLALAVPEMKAPLAAPSPAPNTATPASESSRSSPGKQPDAENGKAKQQKNEATTAVSPVVQRPVKPKPVEPRFSFYELLPEKEVLIQENEIRALKREEVQGKATGLSGSYVLQAGSFPTEAEASQLKERLLQLKVKGRMEAVLIEGASWYRVKVGPYSSLVDADKMRAYLRRNEIDTVVQKDLP
ncbi:MAG: hypothetical protein RIQ52_1458 [Pseudomonadota bacterium]|jgi:cell division protein FtsN